MENRIIFTLTFITICCMVFTVSILFLLFKYQKFEQRFDLVNETFKQWRSNFNELRGICDGLMKNIDATNERIDELVRYNEETIPAIEAMKERKAKHGEKT